MGAPSITLSAFGMTDVGKQREHNEDSFVVVPEHNVFVVADGMGGHQAGDVASKLATSFIGDFFLSMAGEEATWPSNFERHLSEEENRLVTSVNLANRRIFEQSRQNQSLSGMGTTVVMALFSSAKGKAFVGHVGDSRAYRIRAGKIEQLTRDHSLYNEPFPNMSESEREELPRNVITRALGMEGSVTVDVSQHRLEPGDLYLLCSDGLSGMVTDEELLDLVSPAEANEHLDGACKKLLDAANDHGGEDNITVVLVRVDAVSNGTDRPTEADVELADTGALEVASVDTEETTQELGPDTMKRIKR